MDVWYASLDAIREFLARGGPVIVLIAWVTFVMWALIVDRWLYLLTEHQRLAQAELAAWSGRVDPDSWYSRSIRQEIVGRLAERLTTGIPLIKSLAAICPLLGLLGTVTGMVTIFDVMAAIGSSSPRAVAAGVAQATMTTMAGMVGALSGFFPAVMLARMAHDRLSDISLRATAPASMGVPRLRSLPRSARWLFSLAAAALVTLSLILLMQQLIATGERALTERTSFYFTDFVRVAREETLERKELKPLRPETPAAPPDQPLPQLDADLDAGRAVIAIRGPAADTEVSPLSVTGVTGYLLQDADYMPIVKVQAIYPPRARILGHEGWVIVEFTITTTGAVRDVVVAESSNLMFNQSAVQAAAKFKYKPRVVNGVPVEVTGVKHLLTYRLDE